MTRLFWAMALCASISNLAIREAAAGGRGGGYSGGGMQRGGSGGRGYEGGSGGMGRSPSFSQPSSRSYEGSSGQESGSRNANGSAAGAYAGKNQQGSHPEAAGAAAGSTSSKNNQQGNHPEAAGAAAGAGYSNRNSSGNYPNAGAAAAGAGYANRNQNPYPNAGAAAAGAAYGSNNGYHNGASAGYWNGNYGNNSIGSYGGMGSASSAYGYGSTPYVNPYVSMMGMGAGGGGGGAGQPQPANIAPAANPTPFDYTQPVNTAAATTNMNPPGDPSTTPAALASQAFQTGDYASAIQLTQQALGQSPNDVDLHQLLALGLFAQGRYEQAAAPLYAVLAAGPGWDWTTLIGHYSDAGAYTIQLRGLESFVRANPGSAAAALVEAYQYICQGHGQSAIKPLKAVVALQPGDGVSAQLLDKLQPGGAASLALTLDPARLTGVWVAQAPANATITLTISDDSNFTWAFAAPAKPPTTIVGSYTLADGVLTLSSPGAPGGPLAGRVASTDGSHMSFKAVGAPAGDPALQFAR